MLGWGWQCRDFWGKWGEWWDNGYVRYLGCGNGFTGLHNQNIQVYTLNVCSLLNANYTSIKVFEKKACVEVIVAWSHTSFLSSLCLSSLSGEIGDDKTCTSPFGHSPESSASYIRGTQHLVFPTKDLIFLLIPQQNDSVLSLGCVFYLQKSKDMVFEAQVVGFLKCLYK